MPLDKALISLYDVAIARGRREFAIIPGITEQRAKSKFDSFTILY